MVAGFATVVVFLVLFVVVAVVESVKQRRMRPRNSPACRVGRHDVCGGSTTNMRGDVITCPCPCHSEIMTALCGDMERHDLCKGRVQLLSGAVVDCRCPCHSGGRHGLSRRLTRSE